VFASLNKVVKIGMVTFSCTLVQQAYQPVFAQSDSTRITNNVNLDEVEISENRTQLGSTLVRTICVMDQKEIAASPARSIDDLLKQVAGVDVRQRGSDGVQSDLSIRGGSFDQVMILLNGVNITDPQTGHYSLDIPVDLHQIQRIEVLQGSGARIWGPNAFSGAINIITIPNSAALSKQGNLEIGGGNFGFNNQSASGNIQKGPWLLGGSVSHKQSDGYTDNTDFDLFNSHILARYQSKSSGTFQLQMGYQQKAFGANSFYSFKYPNQFERTKTLFSALSWEKTTGKTTWQSQIYERQHHDRFELFRDMENAPSWYTSHNYHQTDVTGGNLKAIRLSAIGKTTVGMDIRNEHIFSNVLGIKLSENKTDFLDKDALFNKEKNRTNYRLFADQTVFWGLFNLSAGLSVNYNSDYGAYYFGGIDVGYAINPSLNAYFNLNKAIRLPTFNDLYYKGPDQRSNPDIKPERSTTYEVGLKYSIQNFKASVSSYFRDGKNVIDWVKTPDSTKWESKNLTEVKALGGEITSEYIFHSGFLKTIRLSYAYLHLDKKAVGFDSKYALDYLKDKVSLHLEHHFFESRSLGKFSGSWNINWQDRAGHYTDFITNKVVNYNSYCLTDYRFFWKKKNIGIYTDVNNLFNTRFADFGGIIQPGRTLRAGLKLSF